VTSTIAPSFSLGVVCMKCRLGDWPFAGANSRRDDGAHSTSPAGCDGSIQYEVPEELGAGSTEVLV